MEHTFIMIKPDGVQRGLVSTSFSLFFSTDLIHFLVAAALGFDLVLARVELICFSSFAAQVGEIISRFEKKGFYLKALKLVNVERSFAEKHYSDLSAKPFFQGLVDYIISGPVVAMVWEGKSVVTTGRKIIGATNPLASEPGTIRGDFAVDIGRNVIHGSDSIESATKEIALWFPEGLADWKSSQHPWIYEK
ncbi:hypothetical protein HU200_041917 [Digitaria exilis]|uniref:Nucleoside diphosphate kinase n=1 Tax=Digitaria exilis TaxID=1010633 RepID=A0A835B611_9POAL|nr:hypothetical protein HU200_041917 [Digitaria exilis]